MVFKFSKSNFNCILNPLLGSGSLAMRLKMQLCDSLFLSNLYLFDSICSGIVLIDKLHDRQEKKGSLTSVTMETEKYTFSVIRTMVAKKAKKKKCRES